MAQRIPENIEKSGFRRGEWVGYGGGCWRIRKHGRAKSAIAWAAYRTVPGRPDLPGTATLYGPTLAALGASIAHHARTTGG